MLKQQIALAETVREFIRKMAAGERYEAIWRLLNENEGSQEAKKATQGYLDLLKKCS